MKWLMVSNTTGRLWCNDMSDNTNNKGEEEGEKENHLLNTYTWILKTALWNEY